MAKTEFPEGVSYQITGEEERFNDKSVPVIYLLKKGQKVAVSFQGKIIKIDTNDLDTDAEIIQACAWVVENRSYLMKVWERRNR